MKAEKKIKIYTELGQFINKTNDVYVLKAMLSEFLYNSTDTNEYYLELYKNYINCNYEK